MTGLPRPFNINERPQPFQHGSFDATDVTQFFHVVEAVMLGAIRLDAPGKAVADAGQLQQLGVVGAVEVEPRKRGAGRVEVRRPAAPAQIAADVDAEKREGRAAMVRPSGRL